MKVFLRDYASETGQYCLDPATGEISFLTFASHREAQRGAQGLGARITVGLWRRSAKFFALYTHNQSLLLYAGNRLFDLMDGFTSLERRSLAPFIKQCDIRSWGGFHASWSYWHTDLLEDGANIRDFFLYVARQISSEKEKARFIFFWEGIHQDRNPDDPSFQNELEAYLRRRFERP